MVRLSHCVVAYPHVPFCASSAGKAPPDTEPTDEAIRHCCPALRVGKSYVTLAGTHQGDFAGILATGRTVEFSGIDIIRLQDGKVAEHWGSTDMLGLMQQLGAVPR